MARVLLTLLLWCQGAQADDELIQLTRAQEQLLGIPPYLIYAIGHAESGRTVNGKFAPWRWTLNINGRGLYFDSKEAAIKQLRTALVSRSSIDIGFMQINWKWNGHYFDSPESALDPATNVAAGAPILRQWYDSTGSWVEAIARYHTGTISTDEELLRARDYAKKVMKHHESLLETYGY